MEWNRNALHVVKIKYLSIHLPNYLSCINPSMDWEVMLNLFLTVDHSQKCLLDLSSEERQQKGVGVAEDLKDSHNEL